MGILVAPGNSRAGFPSSWAGGGEGLWVSVLQGCWGVGRGKVAQDGKLRTTDWESRLKSTKWDFSFSKQIEFAQSVQ